MVNFKLYMLLMNAWKPIRIHRLFEITMRSNIISGIDDEEKLLFCQ